MVKKLSYIIYKIIFFIDILFNKITKRSILIWFKEFIEDDSYKTIKCTLVVLNAEFCVLLFA